MKKLGIFSSRHCREKWIEENDLKSHPANIGVWFLGVHLTAGRKPI